MRVAVIFDRFGPYHCARLEAASRYCETIGIEVAAQTQEYAWLPVVSASGYSRLTLFTQGDARWISAAHVSKRMEQALQRCIPQAVAIPGWSDKAALAALRWCARNATPSILMSESTALDQPRARRREGIKRRIVDLYSTALVGGQRHVDYLADFGMPRDRIFTGYDVVDNLYFARSAIGIRNSKFEIRKKYGLPENYFLASARFIEKKNLPVLIQAYAEYRQRSGVGSQESMVNGGNAPWDLVLLGDGPLRELLSSQLSALNLHDHVHLPGFKQYDELPVYYALAKAFVHASTTEQWGLVVNEAIASGLPVIVSNRCGCVPELVEGNGFTFDPTAKEQLASLLFQMASLSDDRRERLMAASLSIAVKFGPERFGEGLEQAARLAMALPPTKLSILNRATLFAAMRRQR